MSDPSPPPVPADATVTADATATAEATTPWRRLDHRMIWVDLARSLLSLTPTAIAVWLVGVEPTLGNLWPVIAIAVFGVTGAIADVTRWAVTRYRVTDTHVERRTGLVVRRDRSVRRDRIRSVDTDAKLRHRLAGLRVVKVGAGQQSTAREAALALDAIRKEEAEHLRRALLREAPAGHRAPPGPDGTAAVDGGGPAARANEEVLARFRAGWIVYNLFGIWAYLVAVGVLWGVFGIAITFGLDPVGHVTGLADWEALGWPVTIAVGLLAVGAVGVVGMGVAFFTSHWDFVLARVERSDGTLLRTRQGLFRTREVDRDEARMRGIQISEPLLWRWMGMADTHVITTGLDVWGTSQPTAVLPRGPIGVARPVAARVLDLDPCPVTAPLARHPRTALRRRLWWATLVTATITGVLAWLASLQVVAWATVLQVGAVLWPVALVAGVIAYRALGHAIVGDHLVVRSGLLSRATSALDRSAVSTIAVRESLLQRRLGLRTVSAMTAAGWAAYEAPDLAADEALAFALDAAPGLLEPFVDHGSA